MTEEILGKILDNANSDTFQFVSIKYFQNKFVKVNMNHVGEGTKLIGEIISIESVNPYFEKPTIIRYVEENDENISLQSLYLAKVRPLALIRDGQPKEVDFPPFPGSNVITADETDVSIALGIENEGIKIGGLKGQFTLPIRISDSRLFRTHFSVLGRTGSGKSYFVKGFVRQLFNKKNVIIFSPTDEYNESFKEFNCKLITQSEITLPLKISYLAAIYGLNMQEQTFLERFMKYLKEESLSSEEIVHQFREWIINYRGNERKKKRCENLQLQLTNQDIETDQIEEFPKYADSILSKVRQKTLFFSKKPLKVPFDGSVVLDMSNFSQVSQEIILSYVLSNLLESCRKKKGKDTLIIIEEVHNFAPSVQATYCKDKIVQVAREGRKLGISLGLISQRPRHFDQTVLSQCGSYFLFNIPHPDDIDHIFGVSPVYNSEMINIIRKLNVGECLLIGDIVKYPIAVKIAFENTP